MAAYRRRQAHSSNYHSVPPPPSSLASSLAAEAIRASTEYGDPLLLSDREPSVASAHHQSLISYAKGPAPCEDVTKENVVESNEGFWSSLARNAKAILEDNNDEAQSHSRSESKTIEKFERARKSQEGIMGIENRTSDIIQETHRIRMREKDNSTQKDQTSNASRLQKQSVMQSHMPPQSQSQMHTDWEMQLKASRDVAMAMATKAKLLLRELKTVKADLAFAKERCRQLEQENKIIWESREKGGTLEDDDLVRLQLETLLAEKAQLAQENSVYARENRILREIVEYHQLTMQDVVHLDEGSEEVNNLYSFKITTSSSHGSTTLPSQMPTAFEGAISHAMQNGHPGCTQLELNDFPNHQARESSLTRMGD